MTTHIRKLTRVTISRVIVALTASILLTTMWVGIARMQAKQPYDRDKLLRVVQLNALPTSEVVQAIEQRGVDFRMTSEIESQFRGAGARPEVINAMRANYRAATPSSPGNSTSTTTTPTRPRPSVEVPTGAPLSKAEIITMLQSGVAITLVEKFVEARGVSFSITPQTAREIKDAGGNNALIGAITAKATEAPISPPSHDQPAAPTGPDYDELTDRAVAAIQANNHNTASSLLRQAVDVDSSKPQAYALLGLVQLYGNRDSFSAERSMRAAIERDGGAPFRVYHDHDGLFTAWCQGSLFVSKKDVTYRADDGNHTFEAGRAEIKEAKINGFVGAQYGAFHLKVGTGASKGNNYNFAPATRQKSESSLIIKLIDSYQR